MTRVRSVLVEVALTVALAAVAGLVVGYLFGVVAP